MRVTGLLQRSIRPPDDTTPNANDPASVPPSSVGPDQLVAPGDPHGLTVEAATGVSAPPPTISPSAWSGWPADWSTPAWGSPWATLTDTAWLCIDRNSSILSTMPAYLSEAVPSLQADWLNNPDPDVYGSFEAFCKSLFWDYQAVGEVFVLCTARYSTGWPARFHVVPPWMVSIEIDQGLRQYQIGGLDVTEDILHIRYTEQVGYAHGIGPLEAGNQRVIASQVLIRYATNLAAGGGIPSGVLQHPQELSPDQAQTMKADWVNARLSSIGEPAVLAGGITWTPTQINPNEMALTGLLDRQEGRIAQLLGMPSELVGIPTSTDPMTYKNVAMWHDLHWKQGLKPKARHVMKELSGWALPRGTWVELNADSYVAGEPLERAQTAQILAAIVDPVSGAQALTVQEIRDAEGLDTSTPSVSSGVTQ